MSEKNIKRLLSKNRVPPGGSWFYTVPETGAKLQDRMSLLGLVRSVEAHYRANNMPVPEDLQGNIEQFICENMPEGVCTGDASKSRRLDFFSVLGATELIIKRRILNTDDFYVTRNEAARRASICDTCPLNLKHMCTTCNGLRETFKKLVANRTTPYDSKLGVCEACGCGLSAKVHINKKHLPPMPEDTIHKVPDYCWALGE